MESQFVFSIFRPVSDSQLQAAATVLSMIIHESVELIGTGPRFL